MSCEQSTVSSPAHGCTTGAPPCAGRHRLQAVIRCALCSTRTWQDAAQASTASRSCGSDTAHTRHWSCVMMTFAFSSANLRGGSGLLFGRRRQRTADNGRNAASATYFAYTEPPPFEVSPKYSPVSVYGVHTSACLQASSAANLYTVKVLHFLYTCR